MTTARVRCQPRRLLVTGIVLFIVTATVDVVAHALGAHAWATSAHVATVLAMVLTLGGVVIDGVARRRRFLSEEEIRHAVR